MRRAFWILVVLSSALPVALGQQPPPQPPPPQPPLPAQQIMIGGKMPAGRMMFQGAVPQNAASKANEFTDAITLPTDRQARKLIEAAEDCLQHEDWGNGARILQSLLDGKEDVFLQVTRKDVNGQETAHWTSVRAEANH